MKMVDAKSQAQKIAFAPLTFQAVRSALNLGILKVLDDAGKDGLCADKIEKSLGLAQYTVSTLLEVLESAGILECKGGAYVSTKIAQCFLYDQMTKINTDFVHDVCYRGAFYLQESFANGKPEGLKVFGNWPTVYEGLSQLPPQVQKSWFAFDHFYSDNAFDGVIKIILSKKPERVFDVGCNTGKFELALFSKGFKGEVTLIDLPQQLKKAEENLKAAGFGKNCGFYPADVLKKETKFPENPAPDAILMSQFLDCFSKEQIISIVQKARNVMTEKSRLYILEPFWDNQKFEAAKLSLTHTSLYFTAIANGSSKMYSRAEMESCVKTAGLKVEKTHENVGNHEYTLLECVK
ncbi:MAG: methyltransferase domain-containing protein [Endomicrobium sp.]|jgi:ubiquinone/menaquinone biosynthesis C-methylase UbiE|nr:methyltransferase domain-containing protein [Endomicrobium sp.]